MQLYRPGQSRLKSSQSKRDEEGGCSSASPDPPNTGESKKDIKVTSKESNNYNYRSSYDSKKRSGRNQYYEDKYYPKKNYYYEDDYNNSSKGSRKGYSYYQERENKAKYKTSKQDDSYKSKTYTRSTSQEEGWIRTGARKGDFVLLQGSLIAQ